MVIGFNETCTASSSYLCVLSFSSAAEHQLLMVRNREHEELVLLSRLLSVTVSRSADDCASGFMSMDRMEAALQGGTESENHVLGDVVVLDPIVNRQAILPYMNFTCDGSILSWTFGAQWEGNSPKYTELQIWRSSGDGSYTKVGSTTIMLEEESSTRLYQYTLTSPLPFQVGDILGFFQGSQLGLLLEDVGSDHSLHYNIQDSPSSHFVITSNTRMFDRYHLLISVETSECRTMVISSTVNPLCMFQTLQAVIVVS